MAPFFLRFDGAQRVTYDGPVQVHDIDVPPFELPVGNREQFIAKVLRGLEQTFDGSLRFVTTAPEDGPYSTVFIGGNDSAFSEFGSFHGLAEKVDVGNADPNDKAFVFSETIDLSSGSPHELTSIIAHEVGHLIGDAHEEHVESEGPLGHVAATVNNSARTITFNNESSTVEYDNSTQEITVGSQPGIRFNTSNSSDVDFEGSAGRVTLDFRDYNPSSPANTGLIFEIHEKEIIVQQNTNSKTKIGTINFEPGIKLKKLIGTRHEDIIRFHNKSENLLDASARSIDALGSDDTIDFADFNKSITAEINNTEIEIASIKLKVEDVQKLIATPETDHFTFAKNAGLKNGVDAGAGTETLDLSKSTDGKYFTFLNSTDVKVGDTRTDPDAAIYKNFEHVTGTKDDDVFRFEDTANAFGNTPILMGGTSRSDLGDTLDFGAYTQPVKVNLSTTAYPDGSNAIQPGTVQRGNARAVATVSNFEHIIGGSANDILVGNLQANILKGNEGDDTLDGQGLTNKKQKDVYEFGVGWGTDSVVASPDSQSEYDFSIFDTGVLNFNVSASQASLSDDMEFESHKARILSRDRQQATCLPKAGDFTSTVIFPATETTSLDFSGVDESVHLSYAIGPTSVAVQTVNQSLTGNGHLLSFENVTNIKGGKGNNTYHMEKGAVLPGTLTGGGDTQPAGKKNAIDYTNYGGTRRRQPGSRDVSVL